MSASSSIPVFKPRPGQVDYTHARWAPIVNCLVVYRGKILLVQRHQKMHFYPGYWNGISGFLDDQKSLDEKVTEELREEVGIPKTKIRSIRLGEIFDQEAPKYRKTWIVHPVLVNVTTDKVVLDWEARAYAWLTIQEAKKLPLLPGADLVIRALAKWIK